MKINKSLAYLNVLSLCTALCFAFSVVPAFAEGPSIDEIKKLREQKDEATRRAEEMIKERENFVKEIRRVESLNRKYTKEINKVRNELEEREGVFEARLKDLEKRIDRRAISKQEEQSIQEETYQIASELEAQTTQILSKGGDLDPEDEKFIEELARAHYNMGNIFFERGEYHRSVVEYYQAVDLQPYDPDTHYNLAFISGEYLGDQETALKHYQWYLYLKPDAKDSARVKQKIIQAKLHIRGKIDSKLDSSGTSGHYNFAR